MLKPRSPQESFYGSYLYDRIVPVDHLLCKINQVVNFSFAGETLQDRYNPAIGRPAEDPEFMLRLCLLTNILLSALMIYLPLVKVLDHDIQDKCKMVIK